MKIKPFKITSAGNTLRGIMLNCDAKAPKKTVILCHGFASNMLITSPYAKAFTDSGYAVIMFDFLYVRQWSFRWQKCKYERTDSKEKST